MLVWVIYDITDDKTRNNVAKTCKGYGLYRVQKSAFLGNLNLNELDSLAVECEEMVNEDTDSVYVFPVCDGCFKKVKLIGDSFDRELVSDQVITKIF